MNTYKFCLILLVLAGFSLSSCHDDLGNYNYSDINEITVSNIDSIYNKEVGEIITIKPTLSFTKDEDNNPDRYVYEWEAVAYGATVSEGIIKKMATTRNLENFELTWKAGYYDLFYRITDKETGVQFQTKCRLNLSTIITNGFLVMNDVDGTMRLDMLSYRDNAYTYYKDILKTVGCELPPQEKPIKIVSYYDGGPTIDGGYALYLLTSTGSNRIHYSTFQYLPSYNVRNQFLGKVPDGFKLDNLVGSQSAAVAYAQGDLFNYYAPGQVLWGTPCNTLDGISKFYASPHISFVSGSGGIVFDDQSKSFYKLAQGANKCSLLPTGTLTSFTNTGKDLVYLEYRWAPANSHYAVLHDPTTKKYHVLRLLTTGVQEIYKEITGPDLDQVKFFIACSEYPTYLFYCTGNKVYQYDMGTGTTKLMLDTGSDQITFLRIYEKAPTTSDSYRTKLVICTYNESSKEGKMNFYSVPPVNGNLIEHSTYSGFSKIISFLNR